MSHRYRIVYRREECLGDAVCTAIDPDFWHMDRDGKASPASDHVEEEQLKDALLAEALCPARIIHIIR